MTEFKMPFVRDLVTARSRHSDPGVASDDPVADTATPTSAPLPHAGSWLRPLTDLLTEELQRLDADDVFESAINTIVARRGD